MKSAIAKLGRPVSRLLTGSFPRILMYHRFSEDASQRRTSAEFFAAQLEHIRRHYQPVSLTELLDCWQQGRNPPRRAVAVTIDDGYEDFGRVAVPLLEKYEIPATVFVVADFAAQSIWLWYDALEYVVESAPAGNYSVEIDGEQIEVVLQSTDRAIQWETLADSILHLSSADKVAALANVSHTLGVSPPSIPTPPYRAMTWDALKELDSNLFSIGCHTRSHPILSTSSDEDLYDEIIGAGRTIKEATGRSVDTFCYPNGQLQDFDDRAVQILANSAYRCAVMAHGGAVRNPHERFRLPRIPVPDAMSIFQNLLSGLSGLRQSLLGHSGPS